MAQFIIIDSFPLNRSSLSHQLAQINDNEIFQFKNFKEAEDRLLKPPTFEGVVFATTAEGNDRLDEFIKMVRAKLRLVCIIVISESISLDSMRTLISCGVDQILLRPFNVNQLINKIIEAEKFRRQVLKESNGGSNSSGFEFQVEHITDLVCKTALSGMLAENCILPEIKSISPGASLFIDCDQLKGINSIGIRSWILWFKALSGLGFTRFEFQNLRPPILSQANMVKGFIPLNGFINSFYLYYWCEALDEEKEFLISSGKQYTDKKMSLPRKIIQNIDGETHAFEIDSSVYKLLNFYKGKIEIE